MRTLLITPPMVQFNAPYAAVPLLTGFLRGRGKDVCQEDLSLQLMLSVFSQQGMDRVERKVRCVPIKKRTRSLRFFIEEFNQYYDTVAGVIRFLQNGQREAADLILAGGWLPHGPRFDVMAELSARGLMPFAVEPMARARYMASLYIDDLADVIREGVDDQFGLSRYAERLAVSLPSFTPMLERLSGKKTIIDDMLEPLADQVMEKHQPDLVGITIPFPGNLYGALRIAGRIRSHFPGTNVALGGGYVNTEWRNLNDVRIFDFADYILFDDGELPLLRLIEHLEGTRGADELIRTQYRDGYQIVRSGDGGKAGVLRHDERAAPSYAGLDLTQYCPMIESPNPMHRLWTEQRWMKLSFAHGCYWHRCAFCDTSLDYICRYDAARAETVLGWVEQVMQETGISTFHFVDEAAPPALLRRFAELVLEKGVRITWWTNVRFEAVFDAALCRLLARAGCVAVTGGMECAEERLLALMDKGLTLKTMARSAKAFADAGMLVHAYLMYGFPTQTRQEVVDALEYVRQLFTGSCLHSAFWHRFALTVHSGVYVGADGFGVYPAERNQSGFSENEISYNEKNDMPYEEIGHALYCAVYNYMHELLVDVDVREWFKSPMPKTRLRPDATACWIHDD